MAARVHQPEPPRLRWPPWGSKPSRSDRRLPRSAAHWKELQFRASIHSTRYADVLRAHPDAIEIPLGQFEQGLVRVAEDGDGVVGVAVLLAPAGGVCELDAIFVEPDRMRTGIGRLLID